MLPKKHLSGAQKRKKRKQEDQFIESQKGALHKLFSASSNANVNVEQGQQSGPKVDVNEDSVVQENLQPSCDMENQDGQENPVVDEQEDNLLSIFDPRTWDNLDNKKRDMLIEKGPVRELNLEFPKDAIGRHFSYAYYSRKLTNGEVVDRKWLVYSKHVDKVYCFCCKLFKLNQSRSLMASEGLRDWKRLSQKLKEHESSVEHLTNMNTWRSNEKLYQDNNGNFLGIVQIIAEFDPVMQEHIRRILNNEIHHHYLGHNIQNELISLLASAVKSFILRVIKDAKYFSIILDCTPNVSHEEQMTLILRCVNMTSNNPGVEEFFLDFLKVDDTSRLGLFNVLIDTLGSLDLNIADVRGQGYDNGSNMKGKHQGVEKRLLEINPKALYMHRIYALFSRSTKRWNILRRNVPKLTVKPLSSTHWESRIKSVQPIRHQTAQIRAALREVEKASIDDPAAAMGMVIWHDILFYVDMMSKKLQSKIVCMDATLKQIEGVISYFQKYRNENFDSSIEIAKSIASDMGIEPKFPTKRQGKRKSHFDEINDQDEEIQLSAIESFRVNYFLVIVDTAIASLTSRFEQLKTFEKVFGFLFNSKNLKSLDDNDLRKCCTTFAEAFSHDNSYDLMSAPEILQFVTTATCYPNVCVAYRILLTVHVTVASAERSFSKLKLLKNCLRSTMLQERLNGLAMCCIEKDVLDNIDLDIILNDFASRNARRNFFTEH
ncbi:hypothetical protein BS78_04G084500 [Paspalum vaginatum]|nr:hypothetical protein BS78_04G084500 [Paspalum vaginatum]